MSSIDKQALREAAELFNSEEGDHWWDEEQLTHEDGLGLNEADGKFIATANPATVLALLDELEVKDSTIATQQQEIRTLLNALEAAGKRIAELNEALKQAVSGYKSCLRTGYERILELGGDCDSPEVMIAGNPDIQHAEKLIAAAAGKGE